MKYVILESGSAEQLAVQVEWYLEEGWKPQGGVAVAIAPGGWKLFTQAMVKESK